MTAIFISDLHLQESLPSITAGFLNFLNQSVAPEDSLYILGDFFEVWLGDDHESEFNKSIISALSALPISKFFMHGNRDFLIGEAFCAQTGCTLLPDPSLISLGESQVLLMHGDSLCTRDEPYMQARALLRSPAFQSDFLSKSIDERRAFAEGARAQSQAHTGRAENDIMDVTPEEVVNVMRKHQVQTMIHGHTHRPAIHDLEIDGASAKRYVLGDWNKTGWCIRADGSELSLESFKI